MRINLTKRLLLALVAIVVACIAVTGCDKVENAPVVWVEDEDGNVLTSIDEGMFSYFAAEQKTVNMFNLLGADAETFANYAKQYDTPDFWNQLDSEGEVTFGETVFDEAIVLEAKKLVIATYLFDEVYGLVCPDEVYEKIDEQMTSLKNSMGSEKALENYLIGYGANSGQVRKLSEMQYKKSILESAMFTKEVGGTPITDENIRNYFEQNYSIVKHILVNTAFVVKDDGTMRGLTEDELATKKDEVAAIEARIAAGEDFDALAEEFKDADAAGYAANPHGYFVTDDNTFTTEFQDAALSMKDGEVRTVNTLYGTHIMKKYPMNGELFNAYEDAYNKMSVAMKNEVLTAFYDGCMEIVGTDEEIIGSYDITTVSMLLG